MRRGSRLAPLAPMAGDGASRERLRLHNGRAKRAAAALKAAVHGRLVPRAARKRRGGR